MSPTVKKFILNHKEQINNLDFVSLNKLLITQLFANEILEFWYAIKQIYSNLPYNEIIPGYEKYIDLNTKWVEESELDLIENDCISIDLLPDIKNNKTLYAALVKNFSNVINVSKFIRYIENDPIEYLDTCKLILDREYKGDQVVISLKYRLKTNSYGDVLHLAEIPYECLISIPGLCVGYSPSKINPRIQKIKDKLLG